MPPKSKAGKSAASSPEPAAPLGTVLHLTFPSISVMARALARFSAYVEDPEYENTPISLYEMQDLDIPAKRYAGHNMPLPLFDKCLASIGHELSDIEKVVVRAILEFSKAIKPRTLGYIIAHVECDAATLQHEKQHAIFYFNPDFRARTEGLWKGAQLTYPSWCKQFSDHLAKMYSSRVHLDEFQAIISNREYECSQKLQQLVTSIIPKDPTPGFAIVKVVLPASLPEECQQEKEEEDESSMTR